MHPLGDPGAQAVVVAVRGVQQVKVRGVRACRQACVRGEKTSPVDFACDENTFEERITVTPEPQRGRRSGLTASATRSTTLLHLCRKPGYFISRR